MSRTVRPAPTRAAVPAGLRLGERLRQLRVSAGLTQTELAGDRFSKEYVSQIERGKTRPTRETVEWLAHRLGVASTWKSSADLGELPEPAPRSPSSAQKAGV